MLTTNFLTHSLSAGLILSTGLAVIMLAGAWYRPELFVDDYPPDVRARYGPLDPASKRLRGWLGLIFFGWLAGVTLWSIRGIAPVFLPLYTHLFILLQTFNIVDLLVVDWLIFVAWQPARFILPGTEGLAGYKNYRFHFRGFLIGLGLITVMSGILAALILLFQ